MLDKQLVDRHGAKMGRIDSIVVELRQGRPPEIVAIETGSVAMARRIGERAARWVARLARSVGGAGCTEPYRIPWSHVRRIGIDIQVDVDVSDTPLGDSQRWLREHVIERIPGSGR
ncbi:hypothetical protein [Paraburkholderia diazotrophica]|uniref:hypothetical protein n=1 Tax=Paraburkholderia diazotrophica TaxID=667676 RepID=UPI001FE3D743|nr:hypothetical protein [Paraburkholderia diazotrophica]